MKILATQIQDVPNSMYCNEIGGLCNRAEDLEQKPWCSLFREHLIVRGGKVLKCHKCIDALYLDLIVRGLK